jgi:3-hydroxyisobutyrate dehydrogenase
MLPHGGIVREALLGELGIARALAPGSIVVDTSSADPVGTRALAGELAALRIELIDAGVSENELNGGKTGAITFMVGAAEAATLARVQPLLDVMSARCFHVGPVGSGHANKTLNNYTSAAGLCATLDALMIGYRNGLDPAAMLAVLNASTGRNFSTQQTLRDKALPRSFERRYSLGHLVKDIGIAAALARETEVPSDMPGLLAGAFAAARDDIGPEEDLTTALVHWEHRAGTQLPASGPGPLATTTDRTRTPP